MKKGIVASQAISLILAVLAIVTIWFLIQQFIEESPEASQIQACRASNMATSYLQSETWFPAPQGTCKTIDASDSPNADFSSEKETKKSVAELSSRCWYMFGEGKIDNLFSSEGWFGESDNQACHTCYTFTTPEDMNKINASETYGYLLQEDYEASPLIRKPTGALLGDGLSDLALQEEQVDETISVNTLQARNVNSFIDDFANVLSQRQKESIQNTLIEIFNADNNPNLKQANPYVLITPNTDDISRSSSHDLIDSIGISRDGGNNALFIWIDIGSNTARIDYGGELATHIQEDKISDLLQEFKGRKVGESLDLVSTKIKQDLTLDYDNPPPFLLENPNSYLYYLSGKGNAPLISDLEPNRQYSVVYMDVTARNGFQDLITGSVTGAISGAATGAAAGSILPGAGTISGGVVGLVVGAAGGTAVTEEISTVRDTTGKVTDYLFGDEKVLEKSIVVGNTDTLYRECNS